MQKKVSRPAKSSIEKDCHLAMKTNCTKVRQTNSGKLAGDTLCFACLLEVNVTDKVLRNSEFYLRDSLQNYAVD